MKKYIVGAIFGFMLAVSFQAAYAEVVSMIGKQVDGQLPLKIDGELAEKPVITVEGTSYLPVRAAGTLFGYDVSFIDSEVVLTKKAGVDSLSTVLTNEEMAEIAKAEQDALNEKSKKINSLYQEAGKLEMEIQSNNNEIKMMQLELEQIGPALENAKAVLSEKAYNESSSIQDALRKQREYPEKIKELEEENASLQEQVNALKVQIDELTN